MVVIRSACVGGRWAKRSCNKGAANDDAQPRCWQLARVSVYKVNIGGITLEITGHGCEVEAATQVKAVIDSKLF